MFFLSLKLSPVYKRAVLDPDVKCWPGLHTFLSSRGETKFSAFTYSWFSATHNSGKCLLLAHRIKVFPSFFSKAAYIWWLASTGGIQRLRSNKHFLEKKAMLRAVSSLPCR